MATLYTHQDSNIRKTWLLMSLFFVMIIGIGWFLSYYYQNPALIYIAVTFSILLNVGSYWFSDTLVIKMTGARPFDRKESEDLWDIVENLSITAGLPMPKIYIVDDQAPNAFATGRNKEHAVIAVTTGLLRILNKNELEGVIAHELAHIGNRDMLLSTVLVVLAGFVAIISDMFLRGVLWGGIKRDSDNKVGGILMIVGIIFIIISPIFATIIRLSISRKREFLADASGALLTRYPESLASALEKISKYSMPMKKASNATAHLFISNPFGSSIKGISKLFMTHPPVEERIQALRGSIKIV